MPVKNVRGGYNTAKGKEISSTQLPMHKGMKTDTTPQGDIYADKQAAVPVRIVK